MREREVAHVVAQGGHPYHAPPTGDLLGTVELVEQPAYLLDLVRLGQRVVRPTGELHDAEGMLESLVCRTGVDEVRHRQLLDVPEMLKWRRIQHESVLAVQPDEGMNRIANLVPQLVHGRLHLRGDPPCPCDMGPPVLDALTIG